MSNKKNQNKRGKKSKGQRTGNSSAMVDGGVINLNRFQTQKVVFFKDIVPPRIFTRLKFICNRKLNNAGLSTASIQFNANGIFDFDPAVASNQVAGFDELAYLWGRYRVYAVAAKCKFMNLDQSIVPIVNLGFESEFYTANSKNSTNFDGPNQKSTLCGNQYSNGTQLSLKRNALSVVGDNIVYTEFSYTGTSAANPSSLWYVSVAADLTATGQVFTVGTAIRAEFVIDVEWFERLDVDSSLSRDIRMGIMKRAEQRERVLQLSKLLSS